MTGPYSIPQLHRNVDFIPNPHVVERQPASLASVPSRPKTVRVPASLTRNHSVGPLRVWLDTVWCKYGTIVNTGRGCWVVHIHPHIILTRVQRWSRRVT
jgi:hypothetical protein